MLPFASGVHACTYHYQHLSLHIVGVHLLHQAPPGHRSRRPIRHAAVPEVAPMARCTGCHERTPSPGA